MTSGHAAVALVRSAISDHKRLCAGIIAMQLVSMIAVLSQPALNARIVDSGVIAGNVGYIERTGLLMVAIVACGALSSVVAVALSSRLAADASAELRSRMFRKSARMDAEEYRGFGTHSLLTRSTVDANAVGQAVFAFAATAVTAPLITVGAVVGSFRQSWRLMPVVALTAVFLALVIGGFVLVVAPLAARLQRAIDRVNLTLREQLVGVRVIRLFRRERTVGVRFREANDDLTGLARRVGAAQALLFPVALAITNIAVAMTTMWSADLIGAGKMTIGDLTAFTGYLSQVVSGLVLFLPVIMLWPRAQASGGRIREVLDSAEADAGGTAQSPAFGEAVPVDFAGVGVRYAGAHQSSLAEITVDCPAGGITGVVGGTSSGKSTLMAIVVRLVDATLGHVDLGGVRVTDLPLAALRRDVVLIRGDHQLVAGTVRSNLRLADGDAADDRLWRALDAARIGGALRDRDGLDTAVAQGGRNFSGGQRQRLALARAIVRAPRVLLLDDALSAMDRPTAAAVLRGLREALPDTTLLIAAQQVATVADADRIVVLDRGRTVGVGTHGELLDSCEVYRELAAAQGRRVPDADARVPEAAR
ncbi:MULTISPECIES: ABC transporter ATP-binding protein [Gordonia]|uniref:ABC transporter ATP-binding protein n=1 Tax=Gordonia cholesterolivorans TaxID=559625 RepID=A0ABP5UJA6_9ACTN|nr:ABC transporter ATP-binding protein [Gordonia sihwensis]WFN92315.1 ABC transporter ATP-binding protein [Gordonia sihwensis]